VAQSLGPNPAFEEVARKASGHWKPAEHKFTASLKLSGASDLCSRHASYAAIRHSLTWLLGDENGHEAKDTGSDDAIFKRLLSTLDKLVFADISPSDSAREKVLEQLRVQTDQISSHVLEQMDWFLDEANGLITRTRKQRNSSKFTLAEMTDACKISFAALVNPDARRRPFSTDLIDVLRELLGSSNLRPIDSSLLTLVQDLIPAGVDLSFAQTGCRLDWAAATFAVVDRRVSPVDEQTPLSTPDFVSIYVSQLLCTVPNE
jgi:hypothetical protein